MIQKTTPTITITVHDYDLTGYDPYVYIKQFNVNVVKPPSALSMETDEGDTIITCVLSEQDTLLLKQGKAMIQLWATREGNSVACEAQEVDISAILNKELPNG